MHRRNLASGVTLLELVLGVLLLFVGGTILLVGMQTSVVHTEYLGQLQVAMHTAQGRLEELSATPVDTLWTGANSATVEALTGLPSGLLAVQVRNADIVNPPDIVDVHVAVCWTAQGRAIGENGDCTDADASGWVESPAMVSTRVARKE